MAALVNQCSRGHLRLVVHQLTAMRAFNVTARKLNLDSDATKSSTHYDIIIGGGGLVGTTLAVALAQNKVLSSKRILLLEGAPKFKGFNATGQYGNRVSAINNNSVKLFESIGVWEHIAAARVKHVKQMQVWDASSDALIKFHHEHYANDVACIIENDLILDAMYAALQDEALKPIVEIRNEARIESVQLPQPAGDSYSKVGLKGGEQLTCDLLIGADGANSLVRKEMNVDVFNIDYERRGVVATVELADSGDNTVAWQRFIPTGPVALLPLNDNMSSVVWSTTIPHAKQLVEMPAADFANTLNEAFCKEYPKDGLVVKAMSTLNSVFGSTHAKLRQYPPQIVNVVEKSRAAFPLGFLHASSYVTTGAALIGDAAHRIHPLAGQGVNLGFSDVRNLVEALAEGAYAGVKVGEKESLVKYEQNSLLNNVPIMIGVHGLHTLYSTTFTPVVLMRSLGLQVTDSVSALKNIFMKRAMG